MLSFLQIGLWNSLTQSDVKPLAKIIDPLEIIKEDPRSLLDRFDETGDALNVEPLGITRQVHVTAQVETKPEFDPHIVKILCVVKSIVIFSKLSKSYWSEGNEELSELLIFYTVKIS